MLLAIARLMLATVPPKVIVASLVPSPDDEGQTCGLSEAECSLSAVMATDVIDVSSTSAIELPVMAFAVSSLTRGRPEGVDRHVIHSSVGQGECARAGGQGLSVVYMKV